MPKSKTHYRRKMKLRGRKESFDALIKKRVEKFNALPEPEKLALLTRWRNKGKKETEEDEDE